MNNKEEENASESLMYQKMAAMAPKTKVQIDLLENNMQVWTKEKEMMLYTMDMIPFSTIGGKVGEMAMHTSGDKSHWNKY